MHPPRSRQALYAATVVAALTGLPAAQASDLDQLRQQLQATHAALEALRAEVENAQAADDDAVQWEGYATLNYTAYDFFKNVQDTSADRRARVDLERLVLEPRFKVADNMVFEAELEIEHGGTGSTVEYEADEFGEYEMEVEKGGEVVVEEAQLEIYGSPAVNWRLGHIVVPFGMANTYTKPTQFFTIHRSLGETTLIPNTWHETGVELNGHRGAVHYRLQLVNGLDSSGFSSQNWIAGGYQTRMEFVNADDLAVVTQADYSLGGANLIGGALYYGDTAHNRHQQNLGGSAVVSLWELHARYQRGPLIVRGQVLGGTVENSDLITAANQNLVNQSVRGIAATPVGHAASAAYLEAGYDIAPWLGQGGKRLDLFARYDTYDTMAAVEGSVQDNPRYDRTAITIGINYKPSPRVVLKAEYALLQNAGTIANRAEQMGVGVGVLF